MSDLWLRYQPEWHATKKQPAIGNGSLVSKRAETPDGLVFLHMALTVGSTTKMGRGQYQFSLPVPAAPHIPGSLLGSGAAEILGWSYPIVVVQVDESRWACQGDGFWVGHKSPQRWHEGDELRVLINYMKASTLHQPATV